MPGQTSIQVRLEENHFVFYLVIFFPGFNAFLVALAKTSGAGLSIMLVERCGRRILLVLSEMLICVSLVWL